ncbi:hypothetical protein PAECIP112173_00395 [Paenibacillus sp. JJ-100]|uniref:hypothetical protein n=1 Tax=Paenibacillus sp. JJ-100 TaxID=2974896 RepID=UPI0022FF6384|nr:hypothetical protein [Paenibacillus sp. JJ-100]CAI6024691.1 hypothetical protein PAECIP112173_00395 [Paenibacillus sp. JJ-100]
MYKDIVIELTPEQRFWIESKVDGSLFLVKSLTIIPVANQITFTGKSFGIDYEDMKVESETAAHMSLDYEERALYSDDD